MSNSPPISDDLRQKIRVLDHEVTELHFQWMYFFQLFGKEHRIATFTKTAGGVFHSIQQSMLNDLLLRIMRLCDPPLSAGKKTISLRSVAESVPEPAIRSKVEAAEKEVRRLTEHVRIWRNERLAHNSLDRGLSGVPVPPIQMADLKEAVRLTAKSMNILNGYYFNGETRYEDGYSELGDGDALWFYLEYGLQCSTEDVARGDLTRRRKIRELDR